MLVARRFAFFNSNLKAEALILAALIILLAAGDSGVLPTIREQKHLLHHRSHCRYRHRPQSAPRVLAQGQIYLTTRKPLCALCANPAG